MDKLRVGWLNNSNYIGEQIMLPIWHNITKQEVIDYSPSWQIKLQEIQLLIL